MKKSARITRAMPTPHSMGLSRFAPSRSICPLASHNAMASAPTILAPRESLATRLGTIPVRKGGGKLCEMLSAIHTLVPSGMSSPQKVRNDIPDDTDSPTQLLTLNF